MEETAEWTSLVCGHQFSDEAWRGFVETHIDRCGYRPPTTTRIMLQHDGPNHLES